jgi:uncharacterized coiled-coil DUF342 family protein
MNLLRAITSVILLLITGAIVSCSDAERKDRVTGHRTDFDQFLNTYDPVLKSRRDEIIATINELRTQRAGLNDAQVHYQSQTARKRLITEIRKVDIHLSQLEKALASIDQEIEMAMLQRDLARADAAALVTQQLTEVASASSTPLSEAGPLREPPDQPSLANPDRARIELQIRNLEAAIRNDEANLERAWQTIHRITHHGTRPILKGSKNHADYLAAREIRITCEARLPALKALREQLQQSQVPDTNIQHTP